MYRRIHQLRAEHDVSGVREGAGQRIVVLRSGGIGEDHVDRDHFGIAALERFDGFRQHLARPGEPAIRGDTLFVDGDDGDVGGNR